MSKLFKLLLLICFILSTNRVFAKDISFVQIADVHYSKTNFQVLRETVDDINNLKNVEFVVFTGDNIDVSNMSDLKAFLADIKTLKIPYYIVIGNHDVSKYNGISSNDYMKSVRISAGKYHPSSSNYILKRGKYIFIVVNGAKEIVPAAGGYFKDSTLAFLDDNLTKFQNKKVIIIQHFPVLEAQSSGHNIYNKEKYLEVLAKHKNVIAIISGHYHENREEMVDGIYHIITPSLSKSGVYKVIDIDENSGFVYTALKYVD